MGARLPVTVVNELALSCGASLTSLTVPFGEIYDGTNQSYGSINSFGEIMWLINMAVEDTLPSSSTLYGQDPVHFKLPNNYLGIHQTTTHDNNNSIQLTYCCQ
jgi:hypothetical protein